MKNLKIFSRRLLMIVAFTMTLFYAQAVTPSQSLINEVKSEIAAAQYSLPADLGYLSLTKVWYNPDTYTICYKYVYSVNVPKPSAAEIAQSKKGIIGMLKATPNSNEMRYLRNGITFHYNYYNPNGTLVFSSKITYADVR